MSYPTLATAIDNAVTTLGSAYTAGSGVMVVGSGTGSKFGSPTNSAPVTVYVVNGSTVAIYSVTNVSGDTLTVTIAYGTTDTNFPVGANVGNYIGAGYVNDIRSFVQQLQTDSSNASNLSAGTVPTARLASGTASSLTFLRGDQTWSSGVSGPQGAQGANGSNGQQGYQGYQGTAGSNGAAGTQGPQGRQGFQGSNGSNGAQGFQGQTGSQGSQGSQGSGLAAGSSGQLQYNNSGAFAGASGVTYASTGNNLQVTAQNTTDTNLRLNAIASQTGNTIEVRDSSSNLLTGIDNYGNLTVNGTGYRFNETTSTLGISFGVYDSPRMLFCNGTSSQNWQIDNYHGIFRWFVPGVTVMSLSGTGGGLTVNASITSNSISCTGTLKVISSGSDMAQWQNASGTTLSGVDPNGYIRTAATSGAPTTTPATGSMAFDPSTNKIWVYNGSAWKSTTLS